jgi:hypothetical protein
VFSFSLWCLATVKLVQSMDISIPDFRLDPPLTFYVISSFFKKIFWSHSSTNFLYKEKYLEFFICNSLSDFWFLKRNGRQTFKKKYYDINKECPFFISKLFFSVEIVVRFAVPVKKSGTVGTVPTVPGATAVWRYTSVVLRYAYLKTWNE